MPKQANPKKQRIDLLLVEKGMAANQEAAQAMVMAGEISIDAQKIPKPGMLVNCEAEITIAEHSPYVSRGGLKLAFALEQFAIDVSNITAVDIGSSTGGFTDCLLKHGASLVYAIDVGKGQLDWSLRRDPRVVVMENVNAKYPVTIPDLVDLVTIDVSFISAEKVIPAAENILKDHGRLIVLIKPQFEALRREVGKGGVIREPDVHARVLARFITWVTNRGLRLGGLITSPIEGAAGNREFLILLSR